MGIDGGIVRGRTIKGLNSGGGRESKKSEAVF